MIDISTDRRCGQGHRCGLSSRKIQGEVVSVALVHDFHSKTCSVEDICPGVEDTSLSIDDGLVEVEPVEVERHGGDAEGGKPDSHDWPRCEEEVQRARIVERSILENQTTEVSMCCNNVVGLFFLTKLVTVVLRLCFGSLADQRRSNQRTMHGGEQGTTEDTCDSQHVEGVHQDVVLCLENKHVVKRTGDTQRHTIGERTLTKRIDQEYCGCCCNRCRVSNTDPGTHTQTIREFPLTTHIGKDTDKEVEDYKLIRTTIIQPLVQRSCFPDGIEVKTNCVGRRNNCTRDDVVTVDQRTSDWFTDTVDVHGGSSDEGDDEADSCCQQSWNHQNAEPTYIQAVVGGGDPLAERLPCGRLLTRKCCCHLNRVMYEYGGTH